MNNPKIITVTGDLGAGKGVACKLVSEALNYEYFSTGSIGRKLASAQGISIYEWNNQAIKNPELDYKVDSILREYIDLNENIIVDSRMAWYFRKDSFKVYLKVDEKESAHRIMHSGRLDESYLSEEEALLIIGARKKCENERYLSTYGADQTDMSNFNIVIDTTHIMPEEVADIIIREYTKWLNSSN